MKRLTIITATRNGAKTIEKTIQSVKKQTYPNIEHLIIDGQSTDNTLEIAAKYPKTVTKTISEPDKNNYDAYNKGIKLATGDVILILNDNDYLFDEHSIEKAMTTFNQNDYDIVYGNVLDYDPNTNYTHVHGYPITLEDLPKGIMCPHTAFFVTKKLSLDVGLYDDNLENEVVISSDLDFMIKCFLKSYDKSHYLNEIITIFTFGGQCTISKYDHIKRAVRKKVICRHFGNEAAETLDHPNLNAYFRTWLEKILIQQKGLTNELKKSGINKVAILGTMKNALCLVKDCERENIEVITFLDSYAQQQQSASYELPINHPKWLKKHAHKIDAILSSIESPYDKDVFAKIQKEHAISIPIYSWKDLIDKN